MACQEAPDLPILTETTDILCAEADGRPVVQNCENFLNISLKNSTALFILLQPAWRLPEHMVSLAIFLQWKIAFSELAVPLKPA